MHWLESAEASRPVTDWLKLAGMCAQVLGAKRKHLSGFSSATQALHQGFVYGCEIIQQTPPALRAKAARMVGAKCTLLARVDAYGQDPTGSAGAAMKVRWDMQHVRRDDLYYNHYLGQTEQVISLAFPNHGRCLNPVNPEDISLVEPCRIVQVPHLHRSSCWQGILLFFYGDEVTKGFRAWLHGNYPDGSRTRLPLPLRMLCPGAEESDGAAVSVSKHTNWPVELHEDPCRLRRDQRRAQPQA